jgi:hypothetical protein
MPQLVALTDLMAAQSILNRFPTNICTSFESNGLPFVILLLKRVCPSKTKINRKELAHNMLHPPGLGSWKLMCYSNAGVPAFS